MPFLRLTIQPTPDDVSSARLAEGLTVLMEAKLGKKAQLTSVLVESPLEARWTVGGVPIATTAMLEASITLGTNDDSEKASFISAAHALLKKELPDLAPVSYVVIKEIPAENWGYDGETQAARRLAATA